MQRFWVQSFPDPRRRIKWQPADRVGYEISQHPFIIQDTVYTSTFTVFADQQPSAKVPSRENLDQSCNGSAFVETIASQICKMAANRWAP